MHTSKDLDKINVENRSRMLGGLRPMDEQQAALWLATGQSPEDVPPVGELSAEDGPAVPEAPAESEHETPATEPGDAVRSAPTEN